MQNQGDRIAILIELKNYSMPDVLEFLAIEGVKIYRQQIEYFKKRCEESGVWPTREQLLRSLGKRVQKALPIRKTHWAVLSQMTITASPACRPLQSPG